MVSNLEKDHHAHRKMKQTIMLLTDDGISENTFQNRQPMQCGCYKERS